MRTIKELIGGDRERLPGTIGKTSLFVKEIIERYGQGGNYVFDPASLVYLFPSVPEEQEEPEKRPEEEKAREYVIREREIQKLEIREKGSREFVQRILESARLPGAREILRRQSARQQAVYWLRELVREYQSAEREQIRQIEAEICTAGQLEREERQHTEVQIERVLRELAGRAGAESIFLPLLKEGQIREIFIRLLEKVREEAPEIWERIRTDITNITDITGENAVPEEAGQILSYRKEQLKELLTFTERALYLLHTREQAKNARKDGKDKEEDEDAQETGAGVPSAMEAAGEQLQMLEQAWICLRSGDFHLESIQNYHDGIQKLRESIREWQNAESTYREREIRDQIRENVRQLEIRRSRLEETAERTERLLAETDFVRTEAAEKAERETEEKAEEKTIEKTTDSIKTDYREQIHLEHLQTERLHAEKRHTENIHTEKIYKENIYTEQTQSSAEEALKTSLTEERLRRELEERIKKSVQSSGEDRQKPGGSQTEPGRQEREDRIKTLIMAEAKLLPLIGRMSGKTWESFREETAGSRQRDYLLEQMTLEEFWQAESRVLEKYTLDEQERSSLERLERELVYRDIPENLENPKRSALSGAQEWEETVWQPFIREHTIQTEVSEQDTLRREVEKIREFTDIQENAREMAGGTLLVTRSVRDLGIVEEKIRRLASARMPEEADAGEKISAEEKTAAGEQAVTEEIAEERILRLLHSEERLLYGEERLLHRQEAGGAESDGSAGSAVGAERTEQESGYERLAGLEYHDPASAQEMSAIEGARDGRRQERFRHNTAAAERERQEQKRSEQQQRELKILQETARRQAEELSRMQEQQKQLEEELSRTKEQASPAAQEEMVMRRFQEELRLERLRRGLD